MLVEEAELAAGLALSMDLLPRLDGCDRSFEMMEAGSTLLLSWIRKTAGLCRETSLNRHGRALMHFWHISSLLSGIVLSALPGRL